MDTKKQCDYLLLLGDLNAKNSTWLSTDKTDALGENIHVLLEILGLKQYISFPTYLHRQLPKSCLDFVISNITHLETTSVAPLGASDHVVIQGKMYLDETSHHVPNSRTQSNRSVWRWDQKHVDALKAELRTTQLLTRPPPGDTSPVNTYWQHWRLLYSSVESTSRYDMSVLKVMTDHETTNREKASILAQAREDNKACSAVKSGVL